MNIGRALRFLRSLRREAAEAPAVDGPLPTFSNPVCQLVNADQFFEPAFKKWACQELGWQFGFNRKLWEYAFILNALDVHGKLAGRGLGFGVGREPIVNVMLRHGATLTVTDLDDEEAQAKGWATMNFPADILKGLDFRRVNMNSIPADLNGYDFLWSCGSLEHIGGLEPGLKFIEASLECLKPGGLAVHTTEFNFESETETFESPGLSFYRRKDIEGLADRLRKAGHHLELNLRRGNHPLDTIVSDENSPWEIAIRARVAGRTITSVGLVIGKR